ncbi:2-hydroxyacid dehydrogenase [Psychroflexus sp. ALD_RP9]|uniref:2-hydroxyacid dehydrogenase n=1 Tax=Psychroflexus sp. ALD_RP9 TaxID=2777186 RepID=UPI001A8EB773|nr:glyoxylate/hydroxypyruvate reductase A [Psychroflexus sp. ALD_RP9]QSS96484.1 glyoxylate/hydroxypyruvate reductase A [Psychroflexus sp. ALD_RP9]
MSIVLVCNHRDPKPWVKAFKNKNPNLDIQVYPDIKDINSVNFAISWQHEHGVFSQFPNLKVIASMGAGVHHILRDKTIPKSIKVTRIVDDNLTKDMADFVLLNCLYGIRNLKFHAQNQLDKHWEIKAYRQPEDIKVGIMGFGVLGKAAAKKLKLNGFMVNSLSKSRKKIEGIKSYIENELDQFLAESQILVCLLPITEDTKAILNHDNLKKLPQNAQVINVARSQHLVEDDLIQLLDDGHLSLACLDVFQTEPLPKDSRLWSHPKVSVTPHVASMTDPDSVVNQILDNFNRMKNNESLKNEVDREKAY